jgi:hypothetical protein
MLIQNPGQKQKALVEFNNQLKYMIRTQVLITIEDYYIRSWNKLKKHVTTGKKEADWVTKIVMS